MGRQTNCVSKGGAKQVHLTGLEGELGQRDRKTVRPLALAPTLTATEQRVRAAHAELEQCRPNAWRQGVPMIALRLVRERKAGAAVSDGACPE